MLLACVEQLVNFIKGLILAVAISHTYNLWRWGAKWMLSMIIGSYGKFVFLLVDNHQMTIVFPSVFAFGLSTRFGLHLHPQSRGLYIIQYLFVVLAVSFNGILSLDLLANIIHPILAMRLHRC